MESLNKETLIKISSRFCEEAGNFVSADRALRPGLAGMRIFDAPLLAVADADDPLFVQMQHTEIIGPHFMTPGEWLPGARAVISFFLPFTDSVVAANRNTPVETPPEWLHARIDGQQMVNALCRFLCDALREAGYPSVAPSLDNHFWSNGKPARPPEADGPAVPGFTSNWSERHVAYICGLGTFGLHRGLITAKGTAGRFGSVVTTLPLAADGRDYTEYNAYCTLCGACIGKCPVRAISIQDGKNQTVCGAYIDATMVKYAPYYGCGKCNVGVPCESNIPRGGIPRRD